jgi:hypothetical protein
VIAATDSSDLLAGLLRELKLTGYTVEIILATVTMANLVTTEL